MAKILIFDLETTELTADRGHILTAAAKWYNERKIHQWRIDSHPRYGTTPKSYMEDAWIVRGLVDMVAEADMLVGHYLDRFDVPFLTTRALKNGLTPPPRIRTVDTWKVARSNLAMRSNRLGILAETFNDEGHQKGGLSLNQWQLAGHGHKPTLDKIMKYNVQDVLATEQLYTKLIGVMKNHPYVAKPKKGVDRKVQCHVCGSDNTYSEGSYYTKLYYVKRRRCHECGTGFEEGRSKIK